ncbi:MAG: sulfatase family protein [bacterium]
MNIVLIISDSLRPDYCGCYGNGWVKTPNIDALSRESVKFTRAFTASFPTGPMRKDLLTGRFTFTYASWAGDLEEEHILPEVLSRYGYETAYVGDTPSNAVFERFFQHFVSIVGQGGHGVQLEPGEEFDLPADPRKLRVPVERLYRMLKVESLWRGEEDRFVAQTMRAAVRWLEGKYKPRCPFFLMVDTFDPHEPWDPPRYYIDMYDPNYSGDELFDPAYEPADYATEREIEHMRCMYAGEVSLVDRWLGYLLEALRRLGFEDDTAVILTSDHGFYHGEHNLIGKVLLDRENVICGRWPLYRTISHIPLLIKIPGVRGSGVNESFCQPPDFMPTILDLAKIPIPPTIQGKSLLPLISGGEEKIRDFAVSSLTYVQDGEVRSPASFRTEDYLYVYGGDEWRSELYDLGRDGDERQNILGDNLNVAEDLHRQYIDFLESIDCPNESVEGRREFNPTPRKDIPYRKVI